MFAVIVKLLGVRSGVLNVIDCENGSAGLLASWPGVSGSKGRNSTVICHRQDAATRVKSEHNADVHDSSAEGETKSKKDFE